MPPVAQTMFDGSSAMFLSNELWANVFSLILDDVNRGLLESFPYEAVLASLDLSEPAKAYAQLRAIAVVCRTFRQVFEEHPHLPATVYMGQLFPTEASTSLIRWLQQPQVSVTLLVAACGSPLLDAVLAGAFTAANKPFQGLTTAVIVCLSDSAASLVSACTSLTSCTLSQTNGLDITCLQALPRLSSLSLGGDTSVYGIDQLAHLTHMDIDSSDGGCKADAMFVSSLRSLSIIGGSIVGFQGICACSALQTLELDGALVDSLNDLHTLDMTDDPPVGLSELSALISLTTLSLILDSKGKFETPWLFELTKLESLRLCCGVWIAQHTLTDQYPLLSRLQRLSIKLSEESGSLLSLEVAWHLLPSLSKVKCCAHSLKLDDRVMGFTKLTSLQRLRIKCCQLADALSAFWFGKLMRGMAVECPHVYVKVPQVSLSSAV